MTSLLINGSKSVLTLRNKLEFQGKSSNNYHFYYKGHIINEKNTISYYLKKDSSLTLNF